MVETIIYNFTPGHAIIGGILLGSASIFRMWFSGQILGVSGITGGIVRGKHAELPRWLFFGGLATGGLALQALWPSAFPRVETSYWREIIGGAAVGLGATLGNGCTSGHGIGGCSRLSKRSIAYVLTFMATGFATASLLASATAIEAVSSPPLPSLDEALATAARVLAGHFAAYVSCAGLSLAGALSPAATALATSFLDGTLFACGLGIAGMTSPAAVAQFLDVSQGTWNPTLMFVMAGGIAMMAPFMLGLVLPGRLARPLLCPNFSIPTSTVIDRKLLSGGIIFGAGWGIAGMCPGPAIVALGSAHPPLVFVAAMFAAMKLADSEGVRRFFEQ